MWWQLPGPCSRTIHDCCREITGLGGADARHASVCSKHFGDGRPGRNVHAAMAGRFEGCRSERARINAAFLEINSWQLYRAERRFELGERRRKWTVGDQVRVFAEMYRRGKKYGALISEINIHAGLILQFVHKLGIHARAGSGER